MRRQTDHLNTPRLIEDQNGNAVWRNDNTEPFGDSVPNQDPNNTGTAFDFPLRFPGQYFDAETNLNYNYYRDYDPSIGGYKQSDLIGLTAGLNTYAYVGGDPISKTDPLGLFDPTGFTGVVTTTGVGALGPILAGAILAALPSTLTDDDRTIPEPKKPACGCTCICRADADDRIPGNIKPNRPKFAFGQATEDNCPKAVKEAKRRATKNLGMQPKHIPCKCAGR